MCEWKYSCINIHCICILSSALVGCYEDLDEDWFVLDMETAGFFWKRWCRSTKLHGVTHQSNEIYIVVNMRTKSPNVWRSERIKMRGI
jgi:hypothetical protein